MIDSEVSATHPALAGRVVHRRNFTAEPWGNPDGHGTAVAGIVAADDPDNGGIAPGVTIYNYKVLATNRFLNGDDCGGSAAIQQALEDGADLAALIVSRTASTSRSNDDLAAATRSARDPAPCGVWPASSMTTSTGSGGASVSIRSASRGATLADGCWGWVTRSASPTRLCASSAVDASVHAGPNDAGRCLCCPYPLLHLG